MAQLGDVGFKSIGCGARSRGGDTPPLAELAFVEAYLAAMTTPPSEYVANSVRLFFARLHEAEILPRIGAILMPWMETAQAGLLEAISGGTKTATNGGGLVHTPLEGFTGDGVNVILSGFTIADMAALYTRNDASMGVVTLQDIAMDERVWSIVGGGPGDIITRTSNLCSVYCNSSTQKTSTSRRGSGFFGFSRTGANAAAVYINGENVVADVSASDALPVGSTQWSMLGAGGSKSLNTVAFAFVGASLSNAQWATLSNIVLSLANDLGAMIAPCWHDRLDAV